MFLSPLQIKGTKEEFKIYHRITVTIGRDDTLCATLNDPKFDAFDLIAVKPRTIEQLGMIASKLNVDIVVMREDLFQKINVTNKVHEFMRRGMQIELDYGNAISNSQHFVFTNFIRLSTTLTRMTKGNNMILTNGSRNRSTMKGPYEVANIASFLGHDYSLGKKMISTHVRDALMHAETRKTMKGTIKLKIE